MSSEDFLIKCDQIFKKIAIYWNLLNKSLRNTSSFCKEKSLQNFGFLINLFQNLQQFYPMGATVLYCTRVHNINLYEICSKVSKSFLRKGQFCLVIDFVKVGRLHCKLALLWRRYLSYRNQSINLLYKSRDWFLYDRDLRHERVKHIFLCSVTTGSYHFNIGYTK